MFTEVPKALTKEEKIIWKNFVNRANFYGINPKKISELASKILPNNYHELIKGDIRKTSKNYIRKNNGFKISL